MKLFIITILLILIICSLAFTLDINPIDRINEVRVSYGVNNLLHDPILDSFAEYRFDMLFDFTHSNLVADFIYFMQHNHITGNFIAGEIIAYGSDIYSCDEYIDAWLNSPKHREIILNNNFTNIGLYSGYKNNLNILIIEFLGRVN